jgi:hypothetical protein
VFSGYNYNGIEQPSLGMRHGIDIAMERRLGIAGNDTVDRILRVRLQVRWPRHGWRPSSIRLLKAQKYEPASVIGKRQNCLGKIRFVVFLRQIKPVLQFCVQLFMRVSEKTLKPPEDGFSGCRFCHCHQRRLG